MVEGQRKWTATRRTPVEAKLSDLYASEGRAELVGGALIALSPTGFQPSRAGLAIAASLSSWSRPAGTHRMDHVSDEAARAVVRDLDGKEHELRELWTGRPAVLAFLRHFG